MIEHGWVVRNGKVIDPTLPDRNFAYFAGLEFQGRQGIQEFLQTPSGKKHKNDPFFLAFDWGGRKSPGYMRAYREASAFQAKLIEQPEKTTFC
jgi:hypothetical protein